MVHGISWLRSGSWSARLEDEPSELAGGQEQEEEGGGGGVEEDDALVAVASIYLTSKYFIWRYQTAVADFSWRAAGPARTTRGRGVTQALGRTLARHDRSERRSAGCDSIANSES